MSRDDILAIVLRHIAEAGEGLTPDMIDPARSMKDYGLASLDIVEVFSRSMRELKVKVPRGGLRDIRTINGFVDLLHQSANQ
jgi:acyl carrier protein/polyketide biosynthesis acyl carrier protein